MRSEHISGRQKLAERVYQLLVKAFDTSNFTQWYFDEKVFTEDIEKDISHRLYDYFDSINNKKDFKDREPNEDNDSNCSYFYDSIPPYSSGFASYLGYMLGILKPVEVGAVLDEKFPNPDVLDCDYLDDILAEIQNTIAEGHGYDPGQNGGIEYGFPAERITSPNLDSAYRWQVRNRTRLLRIQSYPVTPTVPTSQPVQANASPVLLQWLGQVADLAELLHRLEKGGIIDLKRYFENGGKGIDLCRGITNVFAFREEKVVDNLNGYLSHLKKSVGPGEIDEGVMIKIGRKRGGKMDNMMPGETS
ncbi:hypothetical protein [Hymenobacter antarcticus]|uniref:Uncharacterized protein n=1 Tax=Hymenobacter antarcticus TaxID=486270 RepID=A0ABP7R463_9BACT